MIIRRKLFTFQDRKAISELWTATKGFRELPKGYTNMTARDTVRLGRLSKGLGRAIKTGKTDSINPEEVKVLLKHLDLPETSKAYQNFIKKYTDPKLIERYKRIKAAKLGVSKERDEYIKKSKVLKKKEDLNNKKKIEAFNTFFRPEKERRTAWEAAAEARDDLENYRRSNEKRLKDLEKTVHSAESAATKYSRGKRWSEKQAGLQHRALDNFSAAKKENLDKDLAEKIEAGIKKRGIRIYKEASRDAAFLGDRYISTSVPNDYATLAHEDGHFRHRKRMNSGHLRAGKYKRRYESENPFFSLSEEYGASANAIARLKKEGATPEQIEKAKKQLEEAYKTYYHNTLDALPFQIENKYNLI